MALRKVGNNEGFHSLLEQINTLHEANSMQDNKISSLELKCITLTKQLSQAEQENDKNRASINSHLTKISEQKQLLNLAEKTEKQLKDAIKQSKSQIKSIAREVEDKKGEFEEERIKCGQKVDQNNARLRTMLDLFAKSPRYQAASQQEEMKLSLTRLEEENAQLKQQVSAQLERINEQEIFVDQYNVYIEKMEMASSVLTAKAEGQKCSQCNAPFPLRFEEDLKRMFGTGDEAEAAVAEEEKDDAEPLAQEEATAAENLTDNTVAAAADAQLEMSSVQEANQNHQLSEQSAQEKDKESASPLKEVLVQEEQGLQTTAGDDEVMEQNESTCESNENDSSNVQK